MDLPWESAEYVNTQHTEEQRKAGHNHTTACMPRGSIRDSGHFFEVVHIDNDSKQTKAT